MRCRIVTAAVLFPLVASSAFAQTELRRGYAVDRWNTENGLPQNSVNAILQSRDGSLWLATFGGVARFDGTTFTAITTNDRTGLRSDRVFGLAEDRAGIIWIGTEDGLSRYDRRSITTLTTADGLPVNAVEVLASHPDGSILYGTHFGGLGRVANGKVDVIIPPRGTLGNGITAIAVDSTGTIWASGESGVWRIDSAGATPINVLPRRTKPSNATRFVVREGVAWATTDSGLVMLPREGARHIRLKSPLFEVPTLHGLVADPSGVLWVTTTRGQVLRYVPATDTLERVAAGVEVTMSVAADREGSLWLGGRIKGLMRVRRSLFQMYAEPEGLRHPNVASVFTDSRDRLWVGAKCAGIFYLQQSRFTEVPAAKGTRCGYAFAEDPRGDVWIGGNGVVRWRDGRTQVVSDTTFGTVHALLRGGRDTMWVGMGNGLAAWDGQRLQRVTPRDSTLHIRTLATRAGGGLWLGTLRGLWQYVNGVAAPVRGAGALSTRMVRSIYEDSTHTVWVASYGGGLGVLRGDSLTVLTTVDGLADNYLSSITTDDAENMWLSSDRGVFRVSRRELDERLAGKIPRFYSVVYGRSDGLPSSETNGGYQSAVARTRDGRFWYPTLLGVGATDPRTAIDVVTPTVTIDRIIVNGNAVDADQDMEVGPGVSDVEIRYSGLSLNSPTAVTFRYRLDNWDTRWIDAGTQRSAHYSRLEPGTYRFRAMAANRDGIWGDEEVTLAFTVAPQLWQRGWFQALALIALAGIVVGGFRLRLRQVRLEEQRNALAKRNEVLAENVRLKEDVERISRHDLRTPLTSIISLSQIIREEPDLPAGQVASLVLIEQASYRVLNMANRTLDLFKMEQGTYRLVPKALDLQVMAERALTDLAALIRTRGVTCTVDANGFGSRRPMVQGDELLAHSMLTNLIKNAVEATPSGGKVSIAISEGDGVQAAIHNPGAIPESIRDRFFEKYATGGKKGGTGLGTYSARLMAETMDGRIVVDTGEERGTTITVILPAAQAVEQSVDLDPATAEAPITGWPPRSILIVDDDEQNRAILRHFLAHPRWTVDEAENGPIAVRKVAEGNYDIVFMDVEMPVMDGLEATRAIRALANGGSPRIIALSSHDDEFTPGRARESGCDEYLVKPVTRPVITDLVLGEGSVIAPADLDGDTLALVPAFLARKRGEVDTLAAAVAAGDGETVGARAHRMRGSFALYGFAETSQICAEIEALARDGRTHDALPIVPRLIRSIEKLVDAYREIRA